MGMGFGQAAPPLRIPQDSAITGGEKIAVLAALTGFEHHGGHFAIAEMMSQAVRLGILLAALTKFEPQPADTGESAMECSLSHADILPSAKHVWQGFHPKGWGMIC